MAKNKRSKKQRKGNPRVAAMVARYRRGLDELGSAYARLLIDPCNAPLVHSVYGGSEGTYLMKAESIFTVGANPDATNGVLSFIPGVFPNAGLWYGFNGGVTSSIAFVPGSNFIINQASAVRAVAACMEISYPGSELNRAGRVHYGHANGGLVDTGVAVVTDNITPALAHMERTPAGKIEVMWKPGVADGFTHDPSSTVAAADRERRSALVCAWAGLPLVGAAGSAGVGLTIKLTCVYEYQPVASTGITVPTTARVSNNTLAEVMQYLRDAGAPFVRSTVTNVRNNLVAAATSMAMTYASRKLPARIEL